MKRGMTLGTTQFTRAGLIAPLMALTLLLSACGAGSGSQAQNAAQKVATPTATVAIPTLNWRKITTPIDLSHGGVSMAVSPVNGREAWACGPGNSGKFPIWRTQDAGATWRQISVITAVAPAPTTTSTACSVIPDQNLATSVAVWVPTGDASAPGPTSSALAYFSSDGGVTWTQSPQDWWINQIATSGDTTYALVEDFAHQGNVNLFASSDHFATWRSVNPQAQELEQNPPVLWVAPSTGDALLSINSSSQLYHSTDGGNQWALLTAQSGQSAAAVQAVWRGQSAGWMLCGGGASSGAGAQTLCSVDGGKTWTARPAALDSSCSIVGLTSDGTLYDVCSGEYGTSAAYILTRLPLNGSVWTTVGTAPDKYITVTQSGQIWCNAGDESATWVLDQLP